MGGGLLGTPAYSAPEAVSGGRFSPKSDQFSLAATLYEAISGKRAFPGDDAVAVASKIATEDPPPIADTSGVDGHVDTVLSRALSRDPRARFDTCEEFGNALSEALRMAPRSMMATTPDEAHRASQESTGVRVTRAAAGGIAIGAMLAIAGFQLTAHLRQDDTPRAETAPLAPHALQPRPIEAEPVAWLAERPKPKVVETRPAPREKARPRTHEDGRGDAGAALERRAADAGAGSAQPRDAGSRGAKR
jgi:serine/threonine-protein kinase